MEVISDHIHVTFFNDGFMVGFSHPASWLCSCAIVSKHCFQWMTCNAASLLLHVIHPIVPLVSGA